jgi:hypothetical protein
MDASMRVVQYVRMGGARNIGSMVTKEAGCAAVETA